MFGILLSAIYTSLGFLLRSVLVKFVTIFALYFVIQAFVSTLSGFLPNPTTMTGALGSLSSGTWWFLDLFAFSQGASMVMTAMVYRFLIRRIPLIG